MKKNLPAELLDKYFAGTCNEQELASVHAWYASYQNTPDDIAVLPEDEQRLFKALMWENIKQNINVAANENVVSLQPGKSRLKQAVYWLSGVAAVLIAVFFVRLRTSPAGSALKTFNDQQLVFTNTTGAIRQITLSDGSRVWVSPNSTLTYLKAFEKQSRKVSLSGEAFFEVTKDHKRPFSIYTGNVITKVWGTSFRIRAYAGDKTTKVDVVTGKVSVSVAGKGVAQVNNAQAVIAGSGDGVMLLPNQEAVYDKPADNLKKNMEIKDVSIGMWKKTSLSFNNTPLKEVFRVLNKSFNVNISSVDESINTDNLKADFTNENLPTILEILKKTLNVTYRVNGNQFVLESTK
ncbi:transmembrane sensor [Mucilaginibacter sp. OAE612]|uniref:FecR family protein n=1 Tax=Mucilaginibacter sp. OAE612 TaxID=3156444 RepID=UPI00359D7745